MPWGTEGGQRDRQVEIQDGSVPIPALFTTKCCLHDCFMLLFSGLYIQNSSL